MSESLESRLAALRVEWPTTPDLASAVLGELEARPRVATPARRIRWRPVVAWAAAALVAAFGITMAASPSARSSVLEWLGLKSVKIERKAPTATPQPRRGVLGEELALGRAVTLPQAQRLAGFRPKLPAALPAPDAVWFEDGRVSFVYKPQPGLTRSPETGTGLLVSEWRARVGPVIQKAAGGAHLERLRVDGDPAYFISGQPHGVAWVDPNGQFDYDQQRLAGNTLLVERADGLLLRVEGDIRRDAAVRIAESLR
jgi:hypothetical protein